MINFKRNAKILPGQQYNKFDGIFFTKDITSNFDPNSTLNRPMTGNRTFTMIKPDAFADGHSGAMIKMIEEAGFKINALKLIRLTADRAGEFYAVHSERPFYGELCAYMSSGPIIAMVLDKENAVQDFRTLIGSTNPAEAADGTIRKLFAKSLEANAIHGSDSDENAEIESDFFFNNKEVFDQPVVLG